MRFTLMPVLLLMIYTACAQPGSSQMVDNPDFDKTIRSYLSFSVPVITCKDLASIKGDVTLLDARELEEYTISHIPGAAHVGFNDFQDSAVKDIPRDQPIVVYCSIGYRSEKIGEKLQAMGFSNVQNLYGSIFEWVNQGHPVVARDQETMDLHTYNKKWGKWVENPNITKRTK